MSIYENSYSGDKTSGNTQIDRCGCAHNFSNDCVATGSVLDCEKNSNGYRTGYGWLDYKSQSECHDCTSLENQKVKTDQCGCGMTICDGDYTCIDGVSQRRCMDMCGNESFITGGTACKNSAQTHDAYTKTSCGTADQCPDRPFSSAGAYTPCNKAAGTFSASTTSQANTNAKNAANTCIQDFVNSKDCKCVIWQYKSNCASCGSGCTHNPDVPVKGEGPTANAAYLDAKAKADALSCEYACKCPSTTGTLVIKFTATGTIVAGSVRVSKSGSVQDVSLSGSSTIGTATLATGTYSLSLVDGRVQAQACNNSNTNFYTASISNTSVAITAGQSTTVFLYVSCPG